MLRRFKKSTSLILISTLIVLVLSGCGTSSKSASNVVYGQVTSVSGSSFVINVGTNKEASGKSNTASGSAVTVSGGAVGGSQNGTPPDMKQGGPSGQNKPANNDSNVNSSAKPGDGKGGSLIEFTGDTKTITLSDSSKIVSKSFGKETAGTVKDITVGSIVTVTYSDDQKTVVSVEVKVNPGDMKQPQTK